MGWDRMYKSCPIYRPPRGKRVKITQIVLRQEYNAPTSPGTRMVTWLNPVDNYSGKQVQIVSMDQPRGKLAQTLQFREDNDI